MKPPSVTTVDLLQDIKFCIARASDAIVSYRSGDYDTSIRLFYKSCLFGARNWIVFKSKKFPKSYKQIKNYFQTAGPKKYQKLIDSAYKARLMRKQYKLNRNELFKNIEFLNKFTEARIYSHYIKFNNQIILK
jgi:hypothetical protein